MPPQAGVGEVHDTEPMTRDDVLDRARQAFGRKAWTDAVAQLQAADDEAPLGTADLERLAAATYLIGRDGDSEEAWARAHQECLRIDDPVGAARCALWLGMALMNKGEMAQAGGWFARAGGLLEGGQRECVESGFLRLPTALQCLFSGDAEGAYSTFVEIAAIGERFRDPDLMAFGRLGRGQTLIDMGRPAEGLVLLDEAMIAVTADEVSPIVSGIIYCAVIEACHLIFDIRRAQEWTTALSSWCDAQPDLVPYRGQCMAHRVELLMLHGSWPDAMDEAQRACEQLAGAPAVGDALYLRAELNRLRGDFASAEETYRQANQWGRNPQPGLALLRLAQGNIDAAATTIRRVRDEPSGPVSHSKVLAACVEIMLAGDDSDAARSASDELALVATDLDAPMLSAMSAHATGSVLLAEGDARGALAHLRRAWAVWRDLDAPYEAARVRTLVGLACRSLGDEETAEMELDAARCVFEQIGAAPELAKIAILLDTNRATPLKAAGMTDREIEVLVLVATGRTNRDIASELTISEHTVARHVQNIFTKLGVSSRTAAGAYAFEHKLA